MPDLFVPHPTLARFNATHDASVCPMLLDAAAVCFQAWAVHHGFSPLHEARSTVQDRLVSDSWPKYADHELVVQHAGLCIGQAKANFTFWNPMDGTSWELYLTLWAGIGNPIHLQSNSNLSRPGFHVQYPQQSEHHLPALQRVVRNF